MARPGITYDEVAATADALVGRGERPTIGAIRAELGTGSPNTIHKHLTAWKATQAPVERRAARLPDELASALAQEIERQAAAARAEAEETALEARETADELPPVPEEDQDGPETPSAVGASGYRPPTARGGHRQDDDRDR